MNERVLVFVEDPGAANIAVPVMHALKMRGAHVTLCAAGTAVGYLADRDAEVSLECSTEADILMKVASPEVVVVGTSVNERTMGLDLIDSARVRSIPSVGIIDAPGDADRRFQGLSHSSLGHAPDWLCVPTSAIASEYWEIGFPESRMILCGHPHYDTVRHFRDTVGRDDREARRRCLFPLIEGGQVVIVFATDPDSGLRKEEFERNGKYTLMGRGGSRDRCVIVAEEFLDAISEIDPRPFVVMRLHPRTDRSTLRHILREADMVSSGGLSLDLLEASDAVVGLTSMILLEAVLLGIPTLSILPTSSEGRWLPTIGCGFTPSVSERGAIGAALHDLISGRSVPNVSNVDAAFPSGGADIISEFVVELSRGRR